MTQILFIWDSLPMKTIQSLFPSYWMPLGHWWWNQGNLGFLIPRSVHQLCWCCCTVLAKNINACLYFKSEVNNWPISSQFDSSRQELLASLAYILEMKLSLLAWNEIWYGLSRSTLQATTMLMNREKSKVCFSCLFWTNGNPVVAVSFPTCS